MIEFKYLRKNYYKKNKKQIVLKDVNLKILNTPMMIFIIGKNGAGKSTLLNILGLLENNYEGEYYLNGELINFKNREYIGLLRSNYFDFISQEPNLLGDLTVRENLDLIYDNKFESYKEFNIDDLLHKYPSELSGGEKQKVSIIRSLQIDNPILLCDEPTNNLDYESVFELMDMLKTISKKKIVIIVSHDLLLANKYADRIIEIKEGIISKDEMLTDVKRNSVLIKDRIIKRDISLKKIFLLSISYFKSRLSNLSFFLGLITLLSFFILTLVTLFNFDTYGILADKLNQNSEYYITQNFTESLGIGTYSNITIKGNDYTLNLIKEDFEDDEYGFYIEDNKNNKIHFEKNNLCSNEVIMNENLYYKKFGIKDFENGKIISLKIDKNNNKFNVVGLTSKEGYYLNSKYLNDYDFLTIKNGMFKTSNYSGFNEYYVISYLSESYFENLTGLNYELENNEILVSEYLCKNFINEEFNDKTFYYKPIRFIKSNEVKEEFIDFSKIFTSGVKIKEVSKNEIEVNSSYFIVVSDNRYAQIKDEYHSFDGMYFTSLSNKNKVSKFIVDNNCITNEPLLDSILNFHISIYKIIGNYSHLINIVFMLLLLLCFRILIKQLEVAKKNEISLFLKFNISKNKACLSSILIGVFMVILSIILSLILSTIFYPIFNDGLKVLLKIDFNLLNINLNSIIYYLLINLFITICFYLNIRFKKIKNILHFENKTRI